MTRTETELLTAFDAATPENPLLLHANEAESLSRALRHRNKQSARIRTFEINPDIAGYDCPVTGKWIGSRTDHRENLKRTGCRLSEPGEKQEYINNRERTMDEAADRTARRMVEAIAHQVEV